MEKDNGNYYLGSRIEGGRLRVCGLGFRDWVLEVSRGGLEVECARAF